MTQQPTQPEPKPAQIARPKRLPEWPFVLPMAVFLVLVFIGGLEEAWYPWSYAGRTVIVGALLIWLWPKLKVDVEWTHLRLGVLFGVIGLVQWVGTDKLVQAVRNQFPDENWAGDFVWTWVISGVRPGEGYNPIENIAEPAGWWVFIAFAIVRFLGPVLVVPVMEELFWRDWLWRSLIAPANWRLAKIGEPELIAWLGTSFAFALVHPQRLVSVIWALLIAWLLMKTRSIGAIIVAHAVTNFLLGVYVLVATLGFGYEAEWYFW